MKKITLFAFLLLFGVVINVQAENLVSPSSKSGQKVDTTTGIDNQNNGSVQIEEQNKVMNQRENTQIQTQEQNTIQEQKKEVLGNGEDKKIGLSEQKRSQVANAIKVMLEVAERNGGIGQEVKIIAQEQNQNKIRLEESFNKIEERSGFVKFLIGPDYKEIDGARKILKQNDEKIQKLNQIRTQLSNQGDQQQLAEQIKVLEQANLEIEDSLTNIANSFSLFGWLSKLMK